MGNASSGMYNLGPEDIENYLAKIEELKVTHPDNIAVACFSREYYDGLEPNLQNRLLKCLASGIVNPESSMGCYANHPDDYDTFTPFFELALSKYHKVDLTLKKHVNNWSLEGLPGLPANGNLDLSALGLPPLSMRVRTGRNLTSFPLPASMTRAQRIEMEKAMGVVFDDLISKPEFGGKYVSITPGHPKLISSSEYEALVTAHIMFKDISADKCLTAAGIAADWPHGRGCYISDDEGFIIWVGVEDHLRIMCKQKGTILNKVFDRLKAAVDAVEFLIESYGGFAKSADFGYVTSCPTNIGTGMRASVHIALPKLTIDGTAATAKAVAKPLGLSVRGLGGENTPIGPDGTADISPSARFCISEAEIVTALYFGLKNLKTAEDATIPTIDQLVQKILKISEVFPDNIMASSLDLGYLNTLEDEQQIRLIKCCMSGILNPNSQMGCYANYPRDYDDFEPFFKVALEKFHKVSLSEPEQSHVNNWSLEGVEGLPENGLIDFGALGLPPLSMRVRVGRNLNKFPLPASMTKKDRTELEAAMCTVFDKLISMPQFGGEYNSITTGHPQYISPAQYNRLVEEHIMFKDMSADTYLTAAGIAADWPSGRGCYISSDKQLIIWVGEKDHLQIMCMKKSTILNEVFDRLKSAVDVVEGLIDGGCAKSSKFGVVTSCPTNVGTGMRASVHIPLPKLTSDGSDIKVKAVANPLGLSVRGPGGKHTDIGADGTVDISPSARFCISEAQIVTALYVGIQRLKDAEDRA